MGGPLTGRALTIGICTSSGLGFMLFGYDQGVFGGLLANLSFLETFNQPGVTMQGQIVSTYTLGCIFGALLSIVVGDVLGRRKSIALGCTFLTIGGLLQATSFTIPHMIVGRIISGLGIGMNTTVIPMWQSETSRPELRGRMVAFELTALVFGFVVTNWMNFGFTYLPNSSVSWRFPLAFQSLLAIGTMALLPMLVESPRWLSLKGRHDDAQAVISRLLAKPLNDVEVVSTLELMIETIAREKEESTVGWRELFKNGRLQTSRRIMLGVGVNIMQQIGGVVSILWAELLDWNTC
ncbi:hypothetical protein LTR37_003009 [Vermiconidia calcicola]|uniref:Uncharacterized protein n=1 Tax=Vermiconidia calcicola TaxID=1690605 RepID=A0ACC3NR52_9PEZI|nr:hypothetical protein LTR37_003009 [Vermiconidia calcicola]